MDEEEEEEEKTSQRVFQEIGKSRPSNSSEGLTLTHVWQKSNAECNEPDYVDCSDAGGTGGGSLR